MMWILIVDVIVDEFSSDEEDGLPDLPDLDLAELTIPSPSGELLYCQHSSGSIF